MPDLFELGPVTPMPFNRGERGIRGSMIFTLFEPRCRVCIGAQVIVSLGSREVRCPCCQSKTTKTYYAKQLIAMQQSLMLSDADLNG
jgi:hypothetical protein